MIFCKHKHIPYKQKNIKRKGIMANRTKVDLIHKFFFIEKGCRMNMITQLEVRLPPSIVRRHKCNKLVKMLAPLNRKTFQPSSFSSFPKHNSSLRRSKKETKRTELIMHKSMIWTDHKMCSAKVFIDSHTQHPIIIRNIQK